MAMTRILPSQFPRAQGLLYLDYRDTALKELPLVYRALFSQLTGHINHIESYIVQGADKGSAVWRNRFKPDFGNR